MAELPSSYSISFFSLTSEPIRVVIASEDKKELADFIKGFSLIFAEDTPHGAYKRTPEVVSTVESYFKPYITKLPSLNRLTKYFRDLKNDELFIFQPDYLLDQSILSNPHLEHYNIFLLMSFRDGIEFTTLKERYKATDYDVVENYRRYTFGKAPLKIGTPAKSKRICRFCKNSSPIVTFEKEAHAISEALGNKFLKLHEECDTCNREFGRDGTGIELDLINFLSFFRTWFGVKGKVRSNGKQGLKGIDGANFKLKNEDGTVYFTLDELDIDKLPDKLNLEFKEPVTFQNIYRCLCKFFLSVVNAEYLPFFDKTIEWINGENQVEKLPLVRYRMTDNVVHQPELHVYIRRKEDPRLPYAVGVLHCINMLFFYVVPLTSRDEASFTEEHSLDNLDEIFKFKSEKNKWIKQDFSNNSKVRLDYILNLEHRYEDERP